MKSCKMTKMHFQLIADVIKELDVTPEQRRHVASRFERAVKYTNSSFDGGRFLEACKTYMERLIELDEQMDKGMKPGPALIKEMKALRERTA